MDSQNSPVELKELGNSYFKAGQYNRAAQTYLLAVEKSQDSKLSSILNTNIAACYIKLDRFQSAIDAARAGIRLNPDYIKAKYRCIEAMILNGDLKEAEAGLKNIDKLLDKTDATNLWKLLQTFKENENGDYDWTIFFQDKRELVVGEYRNPSLITRQSPNCLGLGVFTNRSLPAGTLLMVSNALVFATEGETGDDTDHNEYNTANIPTRGLLVPKLKKLCEVDKFKRLEMISLYNELNGDQSLTERVKFSEEITTDMVEKVINYNSFSSMDINMCLTYSQGNDEDPNECGLWTFPSIFNHSCKPNCIYFNFGKYMVIKTGRDIKKGEELFISYIELCLCFDERQQELYQQWHFYCKCELCNSQQAITKERNIQQLFQILESEDTSGNNIDKQGLIDKIYDKLDENQKVTMHVRLLQAISNHGNREQYTKIMMNYAECFSNHQIDLSTLIWLENALMQFQMSNQNSSLQNTLRNASYYCFSWLFIEDKQKYLSFEKWISNKYENLLKISISKEIGNVDDCK